MTDYVKEVLKHIKNTKSRKLLVSDEAGINWAKEEKYEGLLPEDLEVVKCEHRDDVGKYYSFKLYLYKFNDRYILEEINKIRIKPIPLTEEDLDL